MKAESITPPGLALLLVLLGCIFLSSNTSAEVVNQTQWRVQSGDTLYGIARKLYPNNSELQSRLRRELVESNRSA